MRPAHRCRRASAAGAAGRVGASRAHAAAVVGSGVRRLSRQEINVSKGSWLYCPTIGTRHWRTARFRVATTRSMLLSPTRLRRLVRGGRSAGRSIVKMWHDLRGERFDLLDELVAGTSAEAHAEMAHTKGTHRAQARGELLPGSRSRIGTEVKAGCTDVESLAVGADLDGRSIARLLAMRADIANR